MSTKLSFRRIASLACITAYILITGSLQLGLLNPSCIPNCSQNPQVIRRSFAALSVQIQLGQIRRSINALAPDEPATMSVPQGTTRITLTAGEGRLFYTVIKLANTQRTLLASGSVEPNQSATLPVPLFKRASLESLLVTLSAENQITRAIVSFQGASREEIILERQAAELEIANQGPAPMRYTLQDFFGQTLTNLSKDVIGTLAAGQQAVISIEDSMGLPRVLLLEGNATAAVRIFSEQFPQAAEIKKGIYATAWVGRPITLNPITALDPLSVFLAEHIFAGLLLRTAGAPVGAIAEAFFLSPDRKSVTYTLRKGVTFNDSTPITAEDVRFTFEKLIYPPEIRTRLRHELLCQGGKDLPTVRVLDERRISFTCPEPTAAVPFPATGFVPILSKKNVLKLVPAVERDPKSFNAALGVTTKPEDFVGAGLYKLMHLDPTAVAEFSANPRFWGIDEQGRQLPYLKGIRVSIAPGHETALQQFRNGQLDAFTPRPSDLTLLQSDKAAGRLPINDDVNSGELSDRIVIWTFSWTTSNPALRAAFGHRSVRQALAHALPRASIIRTVYLGLATPVFGPMSLNSPYFIERPGQHTSMLNRWEQVKREFDLSRAAHMLNELNIKDSNGDGIRDIPANFANDFGPQNTPARPFQFEIYFDASNSLHEAIARHISNTLKELGIRATLTSLDSATLMGKLTSGDYEAILTEVVALRHPAEGLALFTCDSILHFWNANAARDCAKATRDEQRLQELYRQMATQTDRTVLLSLADEAQLVFADSLPYIPILAGNSLWARRTDTLRFGVAPFCKRGRCRGG